MKSGDIIKYRIRTNGVRFTLQIRHRWRWHTYCFYHYNYDGSKSTEPVYFDTEADVVNRVWEIFGDRAMRIRKWRTL